jgi:asparagine synthase (glutamine-hydrolysing)
MSATKTTEAKLEKAMKYRNIADVHVSVALSGGLDSSLNLYYSNKINKDLKSINIAYEKTSKYDESIVAKKFAEGCGVEFNGEIVSDTSFEDLINEYLNIQIDMPMGDINSVLVYLLSKISRENDCKVMLVGEGGDEIGGYLIYQNIQKEYKLLKIFKNFSFLFKYLPHKLANKLDIFYDLKIISRRHLHGFTQYEKNKFWIGESKLNSYKVLNDYMSEIRDDLPDSFLRKILNIEYKLRLPELILPRVDYPSMAASVEARSPFMDYELIEYSAGLSFDTKMKNGVKTILKEIAKDKLPKYILNHPKVGFGMLLTPFLQNTMPVWFQKELLLKENKLHKYISKEYLESLFKKHQKDKNQGYKMWILYALSRWIRVNFA